MDARPLDRHLAGLAVSHRGLAVMVERLADEGELDVAAASLLPGWTVGHVLTHLSRNADSVTRALQTSARGDVVDRYVGGAAGRAAEIDAGAGRPAGEQVADLVASIATLDAALAGHSRWDGQTREPNGQVITVAELVLLRWREVEVHRADLGVGYGPQDWPSEYVRTELRRLTMRWDARRPMGLTGLPAAALAAPEPIRLAWLLGRADIEGLAPADVL